MQHVCHARKLRVLSVNTNFYVMETVDKPLGGMVTLHLYVPHARQIVHLDNDTLHVMEI